MTVQEIIEKLSYYRKAFPYQAVEEAIKQREEITPELLRVIEDAAARIDELLIMEGYMAPTFALYLLAQFREKRAYPLIVELCKVDQELLYDLLGDTITEDLGRILASVSGGDISLIKELIENPKLDDYTRSAALRAIEVLFAQNAITRSEVIEYFRSLFHGKLEPDSGIMLGALVSICCDIYADELMPEIDQAFEDNLIYQFYIDYYDVERYFARNRESVLEKLAGGRHNQYINDTVEEISNWASYTEDTEQIYEALSKPLTLDSALNPVPQPLITEMKGRERNLPCPCGSGKKIKKCCGANLG